MVTNIERRRVVSEKMFPLQTSRKKEIIPGPLQIPWSVAEKAYGAYAREYGRGQSLERLAERGGFGWCEMDALYPQWREEISEIAALRSENERLRSDNEALRKSAAETSELLRDESERRRIMREE